MAKTYSTCIGMRGERTARGGYDGCRASVQAYDGSIIVKNWYDGDNLMVKIGTSDDSSTCTDSNSSTFEGTFEEFKSLLKLASDIAAGKVSVVRHRNVK